MDAIVELTALGAARYGGGWSAYRARKEIEQAAIEAELAGAEKRLDAAQRQAQTATERQDRRDSGGRRNAARGGMPKILLGAQKRRAEETRAAGSRLADRQQGAAEDQLSVARAKVEIVDPLSVGLASTGLPSSRTVLEIADVTAGYAKGRPIIENLSLTITGPERIAIAGPNGSGKSTLLALITGTLQPWAGRIHAPVSVRAVRPARPSASRGRRSPVQFPALQPGDDEQPCRAALARFAFAPRPPTVSPARSAAARCSAPALLASSAPPRRRRC